MTRDDHCSAPSSGTVRWARPAAALFLCVALCAPMVGAQPCPEADLGSNVPIAVEGNTDSKTNALVPRLSDITLSCLSAAPEATFLFTAPFEGTFQFDTFGSQFDTVLYLLDQTCTEFQRCSDDVPPTKQSRLELNLAEAQPIVVVVDGFADEHGAFRLNISGASPTPQPTASEDNTPTPTAGMSECPAIDLDDEVPVAVPILPPDENGTQSSPTCGGEGSPEGTFRFRAPMAATYTFAAPDAPAIYVRDQDCGGAELACSNEGSVTLSLSADQAVAVIAEPLFAGALLYVFRSAETCPITDLGTAVPSSTTYDPQLGLSQLFPCCDSSTCGPEATFGFSAPTADTYTIDTFGSADDTQLIVVPGSMCTAPESPEELVCNEDAPFSLQSQVSIDLTQGDDVVIAVKNSGGPVQLNVSRGAPTPVPTPPVGSLRAYVGNQLSGTVSILNVPPRSGLACDDSTPCPPDMTCVGGECFIAPAQLGTICLKETGKTGTDFYPRTLAISRDQTRAYVGANFPTRPDGTRASRYELAIANTADSGPLHADACFSAFVPNVRVFEFSISGLVLTPDELFVALTSEEKNTLVLLPNPVLGGYPQPTLFAVGSRPSDVVLSGDGQTAYVSNAGDNTMSVVSLDGSTRSSVTVGAQPVALGLSPNEQMLFVANSGDNTVSVVDVAAASENPASAVIATVPVGLLPTDLAVAANGQTVWVTNAGADSLSVIDVSTVTGSPEVTSIGAVGQFPARIALTPDDEFAYVANVGSGQGAGFVSVVDAEAHRVLPFHTVVGRFPLAIQIPPPPPTYTPTPTETPTLTSTITETPTITPTPRPCDTAAQCLPDAPICLDGFCVAATPTPTGTGTVTSTVTPSPTYVRTRPAMIPPLDCCGTIDCGYAPYQCECDLTCHALRANCASEDRCLPGNEPAFTPTSAPNSTPTPIPSSTRSHTPTRRPSPSSTATVTPINTHTRTRSPSPLATSTAGMPTSSPRPTSTVTKTTTDIATPTKTQTNTDPTPTAPETPPPAGTATSTTTTTPTTGLITCVADCDGGLTVTIGELITAVNIALGIQPLTACAVADADGDRQVEVSELVRSVNLALGLGPPGACATPPD